MSDDTQYARATIVGPLVSHVRPVSLTDRADDCIAQMRLAVGTIQVPVTVKNEQARAIAVLLPDSLIRADCSFVTHTWKVGKQLRDRLELVADKIEILRKKVPVDARITP
jgi:hypothetical protein